MPGNPAVVQVDLVTDATDTTREFRAATDAVQDYGRATEAASKQSEDAGRRMNVSADAADNMASKSSQATGALGALSAGFELVGLDAYATGLQSAAMATDFMSGVGDSLNLIMQSQAITWVRNTAASVAHGTVTAALAVKTAVMTAAQWALNAAMTANPIGLVVLAIVALIAGLVLAYKKSAAFRTIVQATGRAAAAAIGWVVDKVTALVSWVKDRAPAALAVFKDAVGLYLGLVLAPWRLLFDLIKKVVGWVRDTAPAAFGVFKDAVVRVGDAILAPFQALWDLIQNILDAIRNIKVPNLPDLNPFGRTTATPAAVGGDTFQITVQGFVGNEDLLVEKLEAAAARLRRRTTRGA